MAKREYLRDNTFWGFNLTGRIIRINRFAVGSPKLPSATSVNSDIKLNKGEWTESIMKESITEQEAIEYERWYLENEKR